MHQTQGQQHASAQIQQTLHVTSKRRGKIIFIASLVFGAIIASGFYSFELLPTFSKRYNSALSEFRSIEANYKKTQLDINNNVSDSILKSSFLKTKKEYDEKLSNFLIVKKEEKVIEFPSLQLFLGDFGPWLAVSCYTLFFTFISFLYLRRFKGLILIHSVMIMGCIFYMLWIFQQFQDLEKWKYYVMTFLSAFVMIVGIWYVFKSRKSKIDKLAEQKRETYMYIYKNYNSEEELEGLEQLLIKHQKELKESV